MDLAESSAQRFDALHEVLQGVSLRRDAGDVVPMTMAQVVDAIATDGPL
jgi:ABC-type histidine transport system ATPase subunit